MGNTKKSHYVPQTYLRRFSIEDKKKQIFVYSGETEKSYIASITDIAQERYFYDTFFDEHLMMGNVTGMKDMLSKLEGVLPEVFDVLERDILRVNNAGDTLSYFLFLMFIRTKSARRMLSKYTKEKMGLSDAEIHVTSFHLLRQEFTDAMKDRKVFRLRSFGKIRFITSDNPVVLTVPDIVSKNIHDFNNGNLRDLLHETTFMFSLSRKTLLVLPAENFGPIRDNSGIVTRNDILTSYLSGLSREEQTYFYSSESGGLLDIIRQKFPEIKRLSER